MTLKKSARYRLVLPKKTGLVGRCGVYFRITWQSWEKQIYKISSPQTFHLLCQKTWCCRPFQGKARQLSEKPGLTPAFFSASNNSAFFNWFLQGSKIIKLDYVNRLCLSHSPSKSLMAPGCYQTAKF